MVRHPLVPLVAAGEPDGGSKVDADLGLIKGGIVLGHFLALNSEALMMTEAQNVLGTKAMRLAPSLTG